MEKLSENPQIIYDGAHNEPAIYNLKDMVNMYYNRKKRVYIISILKRKDYENMLRLLLEDEDAEFIFTSGNNDGKYATSEELYNVALKCRKGQAMYEKSLCDAIRDIMQNKDNKKVNFIVGSFYVYGDVINMINNINKD